MNFEKRRKTKEMDERRLSKESLLRIIDRKNLPDELTQKAAEELLARSDLKIKDLVTIVEYCQPYLKNRAAEQLLQNAAYLSDLNCIFNHVEDKQLLLAVSGIFLSKGEIPGLTESRSLVKKLGKTGKVFLKKTIEKTMIEGVKNIFDFNVLWEFGDPKEREKQWELLIRNIKEECENDHRTYTFEEWFSFKLKCNITNSLEAIWPLAYKEFMANNPSKKEIRDLLIDGYYLNDYKDQLFEKYLELKGELSKEELASLAHIKPLQSKVWSMIKPKLDDEDLWHIALCTGSDELKPLFHFKNFAKDELLNQAAGSYHVLLTSKIPMCCHYYRDFYNLYKTAENKRIMIESEELATSIFKKILAEGNPDEDMLNGIILFAPTSQKAAQMLLDGEFSEPEPKSAAKTA